MAAITASSLDTEQYYATFPCSDNCFPLSFPPPSSVILGYHFRHPRRDRGSSVFVLHL